MNRENSHCIVYRTGGRDNFTWHRSLAMSQAEAIQRREEMRRGGHVAYVVQYQPSLAIGLPETFEGLDSKRA